MSLRLHSIQDPRDALSKARRMELFNYAQANGVKEITLDWPATLMRRKLRELNLTNIPIPRRTLGKPDKPTTMRNSNGKPLPVSDQTPPEKVEEVDAEADLMRQFQTRAQPSEPPSLRVETMTRAQLSKACKERGIRFARTAKKEELAEKLRGQIAA